VLAQDKDKGTHFVRVGKIEDMTVEAIKSDQVPNGETLEIGQLLPQGLITKEKPVQSLDQVQVTGREASTSSWKCVTQCLNRQIPQPETAC